MRRCHNCDRAWESEKKYPAFKECCPACDAYLHCCKNCRYFDPRRNNGCAIPQTEWVSRKDGPNLCDDFDFVSSGPLESNQDAQQKAHQAVQELFGEESGADDSRKLPDFDQLFGD